MNKHLKNGDALLAVSIIGLIALACTAYFSNDFHEKYIRDGCDRHWCGQERNWAGLGFGLVAIIAELAMLVLGEYDILASKNSKVWKTAQGAWIFVLPFAGTITYCLVGRKS